jgi:hypothetical protein
LKIVIQELRSSIQAENNDLAKYERLIAEHKNERLNVYKVCNDAKLIIDIVEISSDRIGNIVIKFNDEVKTTNGRNVRNPAFPNTYEL